MSKTHPLRDEKVLVYQYSDGDTFELPENREFIAMFSSQKYPIYFQGATYEEVYDRAVDWRDSTADREEAGYQQRLASLEKARTRRKKKDG